jgi:hypothetical protein
VICGDVHLPSKTRIHQFNIDAGDCFDMLTEKMGIMVSKLDCDTAI